MKNNFFYIVATVFLIILLSLIFGYNSLVNLEEDVKNQWAQVDTQLQRRSDLVPNLVVVAKKYLAHEKEIFSAIAQARANIGNAKTINQQVQANNQLQEALSRLLVIVERYPDLRSNANFLKLQDQLEGTENRISVARKRYNDSVKNYNKSRRSFPKVVIGNILGFDSAKEFFQASDKKATVVSFD